MWTKTKFCAMVFWLSALCLCLPSVGGCSPSQTYQISESELTTLENHLDALEANNETLKAILSESGEELTIALDALTKSNEELMRLKAELAQCKTEAESARQSLQTANDELRRASELFKASEREHAKNEGRLRTQRNVWEALFAVSLGFAIAR